MQFNRQITAEESAEEKIIFLRNQQIQKQFMDYIYDKEKMKKEIVNTSNKEEKQKLLENKNVTNTNNGTTTKFTTQNTISKNG